PGWPCRDDRSGPARPRPLLDRRDVVRQERRPAAVVAIPPVLAGRAERLPAAVLDLDPCPLPGPIEEPDLDLGRVGTVAPKVPQVDEAAGWFPDGHLAPVVLVAG